MVDGIYDQMESGDIRKFDVIEREKLCDKLDELKAENEKLKKALTNLVNNVKCETHRNKNLYDSFCEADKVLRELGKSE